MSKKKKSIPPAVSSPVVKPIEPQPSSPTPTARVDSPRPGVEPDKEPAFELIRFDKRVKWFLGICVGLFLLLTLAKINYSSIGMWNTVVPDGSDARRGIVSGKPRSIRIDEWGVVTPFMMSQAHQNFPLENSAIGGEKVALVGYYPIKHFVSIFRPSHWGFFLFDIEHGFAWHWNFVIFFSIISTTLLFLVLTRNNFWLSVFGSVWLIFSPGFAWWSFFLLTLQFAGTVMLLSSIYVFYASSTRTILISGLLFLWSFASFALILYPPYQVILGYLLLLLLVGFVWRNYRKELLFNKLWLKLGTFAVAGIVLGLVFYQFYVDAKSTIDVMSNTVYPGKRSETGGTGFIANWFSEYYSGWLIDNENFPKNWLNVCELSHFITFTPVIAVCTVLYFIRTRRIDPLLTILLGFVLFTLVYIEIGFPTFLAKATLFDLSPTRRAQVPFGIANVVLAVLYLDYMRQQNLKIKGGLSFGLVVGVIGFMVYAAWLNLNDSDGFYKAHQLFIPTLFFMGLNYLMLPVSTFRYKDVVIAGALVFFTIPNFKINPVGKGMSPITENMLYQKVRELHLQEPNARWVVLGSQYLTYMVTATGVNQLSGVKNQPDFKTMRALDPTAKRDSAYNRYAHTVYSTYIDPVHPDTVVIQNNFEDAYQVGVDPCSPKLRKLNVRYFIFDHAPQPVEIRCMKQVAKLGGLEIYRTND
ncbi:DUF7657 domain-containing protein [Spirosoma validum]|uniref:YfhO family protein n=1 Tax=Spirosoma validum TaxID=2771355 RepID=A0A927B366_9BACT|nr:hypothetical protein [Spirosoma validum]MBD2754760.1 hypothetical protein [Spirosoma validum]